MTACSSKPLAVASLLVLAGCASSIPTNGGGPAPDGHGPAEPAVIHIGKPAGTMPPLVAEPEPEALSSPAPSFGEPSHLAEPPPDAQRNDAGVYSLVIRGGEGRERPDAGDEVTAHYVGWTTDGKQFDSSLERGKPITMRLDHAIAGWRHGVTEMVVGEQRRMWIPANLAYGNDKRGGKPTGMLIFDIELLDFKRTAAAPPTPRDLHKPPPTARTTSSGLVYRVLQKGHGHRHPTAKERVEVHYSGWDSTGRMFDSSITRGKSATFPLQGVIKGWTEGLQLMVAGDHFRFWIPPSLAYGSTPRTGAPAGTLVFDVELIAIK
jgi:FKBP-type peptidyl-prolyl cis-trans isomerase